ncbi:hypothetical protein [Pedococcus sp. 5OH_020]|uniref:hypothetical protein n=1 Tax=Pedococcus sp. 5OH_020 TaxID=2989814 RepID=UPI0022E9A59A|nr:hypothetical protein [Pedococcus sp. 5OH_020]
MTSLSDAVADRLAEPALFTALVDDAAVFPPGDAPLAVAVRRHRLHRRSPYAAAVGALLVPAAAANDLLALLDGGDPLRVAVVARPGTPSGEVAAALALLGSRDDVRVAGAELGWTSAWRDASFGVPLSLEVPRGDLQPAALADLASPASDSPPVQAKFRTGAMAGWPWPDERELAAFIRGAVDHDLGFKLTGGLHHAVRGSWDGQEQHGLLNVITAVRWALNGEDVDELVPLLAERDPAVLVPQVVRMSAADVAVVRAFFTAYGCCEVTDPLRELTALGLVEGPK